MSNSPRKVSIETLAVHAGRRVDPATGGIAQAIYPSTTFLRGEDGGYPTGFSYTRENNPNRLALEQCLAHLEAGTEALAFASGNAVVNAVVQGLEPGDHIVAADDIYYGAKRVFGEVFAKWPIAVTFVDMTDLDAVRAAVKKETRLFWVETPSNPLLKIVDLAAIATIARSANAISICDGTFATPVFQRPLDHSIDMVMHSTTKFIGGHSDVSGGCLITRHQNYLFERVRKTQRIAGAVPSPFDCWLLLRSIESLPCRVRAQAANAAALARFLSTHPAIERVHYPGLETHPGHDVAARQMSGFGGMISFEVRGGRKPAIDVTRRTHLFTRATSLGGAHSLIEHRASVEGRGSKTPQGLLRVSAGLEHIDDLIADLDAALTSATI